MKMKMVVVFAMIVVGLVFITGPTFAADKKPNIVVIMADDVGVWNISAYHRGMMGGRTPNIDRIAKEGALFTDYYAQQSCTAGRAAFITGQNPFRVGLLKVGLPGARQGIQDKDPTIAELLKLHGYATAQIGKNHLGDRNEYLPTVHGFDEFFGNLYHLNAQEEPEDPDYPKNPAFLAKFGPRGVLDCKATDKDDVTEDPRFGKVGKQTIKDTGPLTRKRMETMDDELAARSADFMERSVKAGTPFFLWHNPSRMHAFTRLAPKWENKTGFGLYADGMAELDNDVGLLLNKLDELKIADNTIVIFTSDNGAEIVSWPDGGNTPFKGEKGTTWEGGMRVPGMVRWPGIVKPGIIVNDIISQEDWLPTFLAAAGDVDVKTKLLEMLLAALDAANVPQLTFRDHTRQAYSLVVKLVEDYALAHRGDRFYMKDLCIATGVKERTLEYVFQQVMGMSPVTYLTKLRLHRVRQALRMATHGSTTVSTQALSWGFSHFGDFSRAYKDCFGELPSETLRRKPPETSGNPKTI